MSDEKATVKSGLEREPKTVSRIDRRKFVVFDEDENGAVVPRVFMTAADVIDHLPAVPAGSTAARRAAMRDLEQIEVHVLDYDAEGVVVRQDVTNGAQIFRAGKRNTQAPYMRVARAKPGEEIRRRNAWITDSDIEFCRKIGGGNWSEGLRRIIAFARDAGLVERSLVLYATRKWTASDNVDKE